MTDAPSPTERLEWALRVLAQPPGLALPGVDAPRAEAVDELEEALEMGAAEAPVAGLLELIEGMRADTTIRNQPHLWTERWVAEGREWPELRRRADAALQELGADASPPAGRLAPAAHERPL